MSEEELEKLFKAALARQQVGTLEGVEAAEIISRQAKAEGIECAIAGGIAMHLYGYHRATENVDLLASKQLSPSSQQQISFGGNRYSVQVGEKNIPVQVIVRSDVFQVLYEAALRDAVTIAEDRCVIVPEWMVILKFLARRSKDILDLLWMLKEPGLVNRNRVLQLLEKVLGKPAAHSALPGLEIYYVQADVMRGGDENGRQER